MELLLYPDRTGLDTGMKFNVEITPVELLLYPDGTGLDTGLKF